MTDVFAYVLLAMLVFAYICSLAALYHVANVKRKVTQLQNDVDVLWKVINNDG